MTIARISGRADISRSAAVTSSISSSDSAFRLSGRLSKMRAAGRSWVTSRFRYSVSGSELTHDNVLPLWAWHKLTALGWPGPRRDNRGRGQQGVSHRAEPGGLSPPGGVRVSREDRGGRRGAPLLLRATGRARLAAGQRAPVGRDGQGRPGGDAAVQLRAHGRGPFRRSGGGRD